MTKIILKAFFIIFLSLVLFSCDDDGLDDFSDPREQFLGNWNVSENELKDAYAVSIVKNPSNSTEVLINNFWNTNGNPPAALVVGEKIYFDNASFFDSESKVNGEGFLNKNKITWQYKVFDGADEREYEAIFTLQ